MMADGRVENLQILFSDIAESIDYIRKIARQKPTKQSILSQLLKKEQYKDLALPCLREEIDIYLSTGKYVESPNSDSLFVSENIKTPTKVSQKNDDLIYDSDDSQASACESYNPKNDDRFSELERRLDMLQNFFLNPLMTIALCKSTDWFLYDGNIGR